MTRRFWNIKLTEMLEAAVHLGHNSKQWNPKMAPYILPNCTTRKGRHLINLVLTARFLSEACDVIFNAAKEKKEEDKKEEDKRETDFLIVGTNKKAADSVLRAATSAQCHYVTKKWLSGLLTNWPTTKTRLRKFRYLRFKEERGQLNSLPKRDAAILKRQLSHLHRSLGGIQYMTELPDFVIIVDQKKDYTALRECIKLGIPTISLIDTNSNPDLADLSIPANDDSRSSIEFILKKLVFAIREGRSESIRNPVFTRKKKEHIDFRNLHSFIESVPISESQKRDQNNWE